MLEIKIVVAELVYKQEMYSATKKKEEKEEKKIIRS